MSPVDALERVGELASARLAAATARSAEERERWAQRADALESAIGLRPGHTVIVTEGPKDDFGRQHFTAYWWGHLEGIGYGVRGQRFYAVVDESTARWRALGETIQIRHADGVQP